MSECPRCHDRMGHLNPVGDASCAYRAASTALVREHATEIGADPLAAADLLAHLRSVWSDPDAYAAALYVLDLGWRLTVGVTA